MKAGFTTKTVEEVIGTLIDYRGKTPPKSDGGIRLITAKVIKRGFITDNKHEYIAKETYDTWMRRGIPKQGDVLLTTEAPLGEVAQLKTSERIALAQRVILLRGDPDVIDQKYLLFALQSPFVQAGLQARGTGTTVLGIKQSELRKVDIPYFPLGEQKRIGGILSAYDDLIENNARRIKILEDMAQIIYREWFVKFRFPGHEEVKMTDSTLGPIPEGWEVKRASEAIEVNPRTKVPKDSEKPFVPMGSLSSDSMLIGQVELRTGNSGSKFKNGDTLFARITPCLENGKTGYVQFLPTNNDAGFGSTEFIVLRPKSLCSEFVYLMSRTDEFRGNAIKSMTGASGRQRVQVECFDKFLFPHPDQHTLSAFSDAMSPLFSKIYVLARKNVVLRNARDLLLPRLVSGDINVCDTASNAE